MLKRLLELKTGLVVLLALPVAALATTRQLDIIAPPQVVANTAINIPVFAATDATDNEGIGFFHADFSTNGGASWTPFCYDVNVGKSATRTASITAGAAGSQIWIRAKIAFRGGSAGDVDYTGTAINWSTSGTWNSWSTPNPTRIAKINVVSSITTPTRILSINAPMTVNPRSSVTVTTTVSTNATDAEQIGFFHADYSLDGGGTWLPYCYGQNLGKTYQRSVVVTAGAANSTIKIRNKVAFRGGAAGDVDSNGTRIDWSTNGTWNSWATPPAAMATINVGGTDGGGGKTE